MNPKYYKNYMICEVKNLICKVCNVVMKSGTSYEHKNGQNSSRRYDECPKCHFVKYNNNPNFQELLVNEYQKRRNK